MGCDLLLSGICVFLRQENACAWRVACGVACAWLHVDEQDVFNRKIADNYE